MSMEEIFSDDYCYQFYTNRPLIMKCLDWVQIDFPMTRLWLWTKTNVTWKKLGNSSNAQIEPTQIGRGSEKRMGRSGNVKTAGKHRKS